MHSRTNMSLQGESLYYRFVSLHIHWTEAVERKHHISSESAGLQSTFHAEYLSADVDGISAAFCCGTVSFMFSIEFIVTHLSIHDCKHRQPGDTRPVCRYRLAVSKTAESLVSLVRHLIALRWISLMQLFSSLSFSISWSLRFYQQWQNWSWCIFTGRFHK